MKFNLDNITESTEAFEYLNELNGKHALIELKKISPTRTLKQNAYLHLIIAAFGNHFGYTAEEAKLVYKDISPHIYYYTKKDRRFIRSSADLNKDEMAETIDRFRQASAKQGYDLPLAIDQDWLRRLHNEVERSSFFLETQHVEGDL